MLSSSARSLRISRIASQSRSFQSSVSRGDGESSSSSGAGSSLRNLDLGVGRGTSNGAINELSSIQTDRPSSSRSTIPRAAAAPRPVAGQFDHSLEDLDFGDSPSHPSIDIPSSSSSSSFGGLNQYNLSRPDGNRSLRNPSYARDGPSGGRGGFNGPGRGDFGGGRGGGVRGGARGGRGGPTRGLRGRNKVPSTTGRVREQVLVHRDHPALAPSALPPLDTLYTTDDYFFASPKDVPMSQDPHPIFPPQSPLEVKLAAANKRFAGTSNLPAIHQRVLANFLPEALRGPRYDLKKASMESYDDMVGYAFEKDPGAAKSLLENVGEEGLVFERDLERKGKLARFYDEEDITQTVLDGVGLEESTRGSREAARGLARMGLSTNGGLRMQEKEEMMKIVEGLLTPPKKRAVAKAKA